MSLVVASCLPRIVTVDSSCGCTLTRASIRGMTPGEMENLANKEIDLANIIANAAEAKALGVQERGLDALLRSSIVNIKPALNTMKVGTQSVILPYIQRPQKSIMNANYFLIESGSPTAGAGSGGIPASAQDIVVNLGVSEWKSPLKDIERYFLPGMAVYVLTWDNTTDKTARTLHFTVHSAVNANGGGVEKARVTIIPNVAASTWAGYTNEQKAVFQPTFGVVQTGTNNVSDRQSWCYNQPQDISRKLLVNWLQTSRESFCVEQSYRETLQLIMSGKINPFMRSFQHLPLVEQQKRAAMLAEQAWYRSIWFNQPLNDKQQPETYDQLPAVTDPLDPTCVKEYLANALGYETLIQDCQRMTDLSGEALDLDWLFQQFVFLKRYRESDGDSITVIDSMTDRVTANLIRDVMSKYYAKRYGWTITKNAQINQKIVHENTVLFNYDLYDIPDACVQWAVFHDEFYNDRISAFPNTVNSVDVGFKARGRSIDFVDWSDFKVGLGKTRSVTRKHPDPSVHELYKCIIEADVTEYNLRSKQWTVMVDRPQRHLIVRNFSDACPSVTVPGCSVGEPSEPSE